MYSRRPVRAFSNFDTVRRTAPVTNGTLPSHAYPRHLYSVDMPAFHAFIARYTDAAEPNSPRNMWNTTCSPLPAAECSLSTLQLILDSPPDRQQIVASTHQDENGLLNQTSRSSSDCNGWHPISHHNLLFDCTAAYAMAMAKAGLARGWARSCCNGISVGPFEALTYTDEHLSS